MAQNGNFSGRNAPANPKVRGCRAQPPTASLFSWAPTPAQERQQELVGSGRPTAPKGGRPWITTRIPLFVNIPVLLNLVSSRGTTLF